MKSDNLLDEIWDTYQTTIDCLKITSRSIKKNELDLLKETKFEKISQDATDLIKSSRSDVDDYVILSLWATFERQMYDYLQNECGKLLDNNGSDFNKKVHKKIDSEVEYWRIDDILEIYKSLVDSDLIGNAKQIKKYRDWIAHRNPNKEPPSNIPPQNAYKVLSNILDCLKEHPELSVS